MLFQGLPKDVEQYILNFLVMPLDINKLKKISKYTRNLVNNSLYVIEKNRITDQVFMMNEDPYFKKNKDDIHPLILGSLADSWNKYYKWSWLTCRKKKLLYNFWTINEFVDVKDKIGVWGPAYIKNIKLEPSTNDFLETKPLYHVEFLGWTNAFDEWVTYDKIATIGSKTFNPLKKLEYYTTKKNDFWVLHNDIIFGWRVAICSKVRKCNDESSYRITVKQFHDRSNVMHISITENNINQYIKPITNVSAFLCSTQRYLSISNRKVLM